MNNNEAFVARLGNIKPIEGADKIKVASVILDGVPITQVVVGADTKENTAVVYFDANMALEDDFIQAIDKQAPDFGQEGFKGIGTYLAKGNRVRVIKLRGVISNGLIIEADRVSKLVPGKPLVEGMSFLKLDGVKICHKWLPPSRNANSGGKTSNKKGNKKKVSRIIPELFHFYVDTSQLLKNLHEINPDDVGSISRKIHGSSFIVSRSKVLRKLSLLDKVAKFVGAKVETTEYDYLYASRSVIKNDAVGTGFYKVDIWTDLGKKFFEGKLHKGETIYGEVVGYLPGSSSMIQKNYDYGQKPGDYSIAVYRITMTNDDGVVSSLDWNAMKERCKELQVPMVEEFFYGKLKDKYSIPVDENWHTRFVEALKNEYLEKDVVENLCKKVPDEGIVLRIEGLGIKVFKLKSERFFLHESTARENEEVDIEAEEGALIDESES